MKVSIIGSGCQTCGVLYQSVKKLKENGKIDAEVEEIMNKVYFSKNFWGW